MAKVVVRDPATGRKVKFKLTDYRPYFLYDREEIANGAVEMYFFQSPEGKTRSDTNLKQFSTIQTGWTFEIHAIRVVPVPTANPADLKRIFENAVITFIKEADMEVFSAPMLIFPAGAGLHGTTTQTNEYIASNGLPTPAAVLKLPFPLRIEGGETFNIRVEFNPSVSGLTAPVKVWMVMDGILRRPVKGA